MSTSLHSLQTSVWFLNLYTGGEGGDLVSFLLVEIEFEWSILDIMRYMEKGSEKISLRFDACSKDIRFNNVYQFGETWEDELMADPELMSPLF